MTIKAKVTVTLQSKYPSGICEYCRGRYTNGRPECRMCGQRHTCCPSCADSMKRPKGEGRRIPACPLEWRTAMRMSE